MSIRTDIHNASYKECTRAMIIHRRFNSQHEGYAVIKEELDELWDAIKTHAPGHELAKEAIQISAMAERFIADLLTIDDLTDAIDSLNCE